MQTFEDRVRLYLGAEDVDSTIVDYLINVAGDVYDGNMCIDDYIDLVLQMIPESGLHLKGRGAAVKCFSELLDQAKGTVTDVRESSPGKKSGAAGGGVDPDWLSELVQRTKTHSNVKDTAQRNVPKGRQTRQPGLVMLSELTGDCLKDDYLEHVLGEAGGNVQAACWLIEQEDVPRLQSEWQAATQKSGPIAEEEKSSKSNEQHSIKKAIVNQFAFAEEKHRGSYTSAALPWGHTKSDATNDPQQVRYRDGMKVTSRGEKHIFISQPEWDGGSRGKVYTKGKRGKGFM